jgi:hypothetical protein
MAKHNYRIKSKDLGDIYLDKDTLMPVREFQLKIGILADAQHDGRCWPEQFSRGIEWELIEMIMQDIRTHVEDAVRRTIHCPKFSKESHRDAWL